MGSFKKQDTETVVIVDIKKILKDLEAFNQQLKIHKLSSGDEAELQKELKKVREICNAGIDAHAVVYEDGRTEIVGNTPKDEELIKNLPHTKDGEII